MEGAACGFLFEQSDSRVCCSEGDTLYVSLFHGVHLHISVHSKYIRVSVAALPLC